MREAQELGRLEEEEEVEEEGGLDEEVMAERAVERVERSEVSLLDEVEGESVDLRFRFPFLLFFLISFVILLFLLD